MRLTVTQVQYKNQELGGSGSDLVTTPDQLEWTEEEETALRHKIDWHIVPIVTLLYLLCVRTCH
jgi:hypothetical protein